MRYDEYVTPAEIRLMETLKGKSRMEKDQIIFEYERTKENDTLRVNRTGKRTV